VEWTAISDLLARLMQFPRVGVGGGPVPADDLHAGVGVQPLGEGFAVPSRQHVDRPVGGHSRGAGDYPQARRLLITADAGGSNGHRTRAWKTELAALAAETGLHVTVCHLPPGTSKWNKIEHRLFSHITMNWRGRPLSSHEVIVASIAATTTRTGLTVRAELDTGTYPTGVEVSEEQVAALPMTRHRFHGDWNYTLHPPLHAGATSHCRAATICQPGGPSPAQRS